MTWVDEQHHVAAQIAEAKGDVRWGTWGPQWVHQLFGSYYFSNIVAVDWDHRRIQDEHLELLRQTPTLEELYIPGTRINDDSLAVLEDLPRIRKLAIWSNRLTNASLEHVGKLKRLEVLDIHRTRMDEEGLVHLRGHPRLRILRQDFTMTDVGIDHLASMPNVSVEWLIAKNLGFESFRHLRDRLNFERLHITKPTYAEWSTYLVGHPTMTGLDVKSAPMTDDELQALIAADTLHDLNLIEVPIGDRGIANIPHATRLKSVQFSLTNVTPEGFLITFGQYPRNVVVFNNWIRLSNGTNGQSADWMGMLDAQKLEAVKYCRNANSLVFATSQLDDFDFRWIERLEHLMYLRVDSFGNDSLLKHVAPLKQLQSLELPGTKDVSAEGLRHIVPLDQLTKLELRGSEVNGDSMEVIGQMTQLTMLRIVGSNISDEELKPIADLKNLSVLNVSLCKNLTDDSLLTISKLPKLQYLTAQDTNFTDTGLKHLHGMPFLSNVSVLGSKHTSRGLRDLRNALPTKGGSIY